jgi:hypothetical protein
MAGLLPSSSINGATVPRQQLLYAYPEFTGVSITNIPSGASRYDSFQSKVTHRFSHGLAVQASFTISKSLEQVSTLNAQDVNLKPARHAVGKRLTAFDARSGHRDQFELPFGKGDSSAGLCARC